MSRFIVAIHHRDDFDPSTGEDAQVHKDIDDLNDEMVEKGVRLFVGGLHHASTAKSVRRLPNGELSVSDGSYLQTDEHVGGFWVLEAANMEEALEWGRKAAVACRTNVEVRQFH